MTDQFFDKPILNSPYEYPARHWELDKDGQPTNRIIENRRRAEFITHIPKTELQKAEEYLHGNNLDEAAIGLRHAAEDTARRCREWAEGKKLPPGEFFALTDKLRAARNKLWKKVSAQLYECVLKGVPAAHRDHLSLQAMLTWTTWRGWVLLTKEG